MSEQPNKNKQQLLDELNAIVSMLEDDSVIPTLDAIVSPTAEQQTLALDNDQPQVANSETEAGVDEVDVGYEPEDPTEVEVEVEAVYEPEATYEPETALNPDSTEFEHSPDTEPEPATENSENTEPLAEQEIAATASPNHGAGAGEQEEVLGHLLNANDSAAESANPNSNHGAGEQEEQEEQEELGYLLNAGVADSLILALQPDEQAIKTPPSSEAAALNQAAKEGLESDSDIATDPSFKRDIDPVSEAGLGESGLDEEDWMTTLEMDAAAIDELEQVSAKSFTESEPGLEIENLLSKSLKQHQAEESEEAPTDGVNRIDNNSTDSNRLSPQHTSSAVGPNNIIASMLARSTASREAHNNPFTKSHLANATEAEAEAEADSALLGHEQPLQQRLKESLATAPDPLDSEATISRQDEPNPDSSFALETRETEGSPLSDITTEPDTPAPLETDNQEMRLELSPPLENAAEPTSTEDKASVELSGRQFEIAIPELGVPNADNLLRDGSSAVEDPLKHLDSGPLNRSELEPAPQQFTFEDALEGDYYPDSDEFQYSFDINPFGGYHPGNQAKSTTEPEPEAKQANSDTAAADPHAEIIDQLVAEYLPQIESQLRQRLLVMLEDEVDF